MPDDIRALSAALAREPSSIMYVDLAEALRRRGKFQEALQVVMHGLGRHPEHADGYDCLARIHADQGHMAEARSAWERALLVAPEHGGALRGIGFLFYRQGDTRRAMDALQHALAANPGDESAIRALAALRGEPVPAAAPPAAAAEPPAATPLEAEPDEPVLEFKRKTPAEVPQLRATASALRGEDVARASLTAQDHRDLPAAPSPEAPAPPAAPGRAPVFAGLEGATADILLLDARGLVLAGGLRAPDGSDASELAAAALAGVSGEAERTAAYLKVGAWTAIVAEAESANVVLAPVGEGALLMLRREKSTPVGLALRIAERARGTAAQWLEEKTQ